jgi:hypothetical protein
MRIDSGAPTGVAPNLVRWGAVFSGTIVALATFALVNALWLGIAYSNGGFVSDNLSWFIGGTAIFAMFVAGLMAGFLSGVRGALAGMLNGMTAWGLVFLGSVLSVVPGLAQVVNNISGSGSISVNGGAVLSGQDVAWTTFWSLLIGAATAVIGGLVGGAMKRDAKVAPTDARGLEVGDAYPTERYETAGQHVRH